MCNLITNCTRISISFLTQIIILKFSAKNNAVFLVNPLPPANFSKLALFSPAIIVFIIHLYYYAHSILLYYQIIIIDNYNLSYF